MKNISLALALILLSVTSFAGSTPFNNEEQAAFDTRAIRSVRVKFNAVTQGDSAVAHNLGATLPARAIITRSYLDVNTAFVSSNALGKVAFSCETAGNILAASLLANPGPLEGVSTGASTLFQEITSACDVTATVTIAPFSAGVANLFIEYVLSEP